MSSDAPIKKRKAATSASATNNDDDDNNLRPAAKKKQSAKKSRSTSPKPGSTTTTTNAGLSSDQQLDYTPLTLPEIQSKIKGICRRIPAVPEGGLSVEDKAAIKVWATKMQASIEEFNLMICTVSAATYKWGAERSGAADQNLGLLSAELANAQDQISSSVTPRLTNVLAPAVDLVIAESVTTKKSLQPNGGDAKEEKEIKTNHFSRELVDPDFVELCHSILCRNAVMLRQVVLANFIKVERCVGDYVKACEKDRSHDSRGGMY